MQRASKIIVLFSIDNESFKQVYQHDGTTFFGYTDNKPLVIKLPNLQARYVRLQIPSKSYFHLDEVEIYTQDSNNNIALGKSATQSSVSQWSKSHLKKQPRNLLRIEETVQRGAPHAEQLGRLDLVAAGRDQRALDRLGGQLGPLALHR